MNDDKNLTASDVQTLASRDAVVAFFATLGYNTDSRQPQSAAAMGVAAESLKRQIEHVERIAVHSDGAEPLDVYLIELKSVTVAATKGLARVLKNLAGNYLLVLTDDYQRLDFALLQRFVPEPTASSFLTREVTVRPRILTVDRRNPSLVQLRVLRRFTYTEADSDAQFDKLLSAYAIADWSEPLFNNRALFSDYYLKERLPDLDEWAQRPEATYHELRRLLANAGGPGKGPTTVKSLLEPALQALGFSLTPASGDGEPDYRLYDPANPEKPVATCLAYTWNRKLDGRDDERDTESPEENPGARVVTVIESGEPPWAIVTNGKLWRLYSAQTHSRSTNYYEIDLEETLAMDDPNEAFRYFWLFFRLNAFTTREVVRDGRSREMCFLDQLLDDSEAYAKKLGDRLKQRVFEQIFPHFAEGFIEHLKGQADMAGDRQRSLLPAAEQLALKREPDEEFRRQTFQGTLTLLYRLLFLLYAESRDLLPVKERRGYFEQSLTNLKQEIAERAGAIEDEVAGRLGKAYSSSPDATELYDRLLHLFSIIDQGSGHLNVPLYDGGLFLTQPEPESHAPEADAARFLASNKIPDLHLALGLDRLTRDLDDKRHDLVFIDYKSLGVRQLGSIYEGLLEFRIRIAQETMAVVKGKKTEEVISYAEAERKGRRVLKKGRGRNAEERVFAPGDVYLENDRRERKASGSYYTPDHIVKYIVENTVGPVLEQKLEKLRPRLRDAQQAYGKALVRAKSLERQGLKPDAPAKVASDYTDVVDGLFDLKVLDPAMGSGHFLVEAVDFICDRILGQREGFLRAFPWNPVTRYLDETREAIKDEMERQGVIVDAGRLTDVNLLKRHVLKRCAYGVDLNPMAVELAKVSLWLDCFTVGAPLSFLDHHLKCGNSLIGTTVQEVEFELAEQAKGFVGDLFGGPFQGLLSATATIEELRRIPDATVEQAERSRGLFAEFERAQAPYKSALDIWVSRHFGNKRAQEYLTLAGSDLVDQLRSGGRDLPPESREAIRNAAGIGREKRFFHWDLEFPEAFVDLKYRGWKPKDQQGFDAVLGNPPYDELSEHASGRALPEKAFIKAQPIYSDARGGRLNVFRPFVLRSISLLMSGGRHSFIVPMGLLADKFTEQLRRRMLTDGILRSVVAFPHKDNPRNRVFFEAKLSTCVYVVEKHARIGQPITVSFYPGRSFEDASRSSALRVAEIAEIDPESLSIPNMTARDLQRWKAIRSCRRVTTWGNAAKCYLGELMTNAKNWHLTSSEPIGPRLLRGANINRYVLLREPKQGEPLYLRETDFLHEYAKDGRINHHRRIRIGFQESSPIDNWRRLIACVIPAGHYCVHKIRYFSDESRYDLFALLALFNSEMSDWRFSMTSTNNSVNEYEVNALPIPRFNRIDASDIQVERQFWMNLLMVDCAGSIVEWESAVLDEIRNTPARSEVWPDAIHDALSASGKELTKLRGSRQDLIEDFAEWLFTTLRVDRARFSGRSRLRGGQADIDQQDPEWLMRMLTSNRRACGVDPLSIRTELLQRFDHLTTQTRKYNARFEALDKATDRIVWQLVGLNPDGSVIEPNGAPSAS